MTSGDPTVHVMGIFYFLNDIYHGFTIDLIQNRFVIGFLYFKTVPEYPNMNIMDILCYMLGLCVVFWANRHVSMNITSFY